MLLSAKEASGVALRGFLFLPRGPCKGADMKNAKIFLSFSLLFVILFTAGCATLMKNYGRLVPNTEAARAFESYQPDRNHHYYFCGSEMNPNAIFGLNKAYRLNNVYWQQIETPEVFKKLLTGMQYKANESAQSLFGFAILDNHDRQIGAWYSLLRVNAPIRMENENTVTIFPVHGNVYDEGDDPS
jgi:hypothetical protein